MATRFLNERLMKAADALLQHGEAIEVRYVGIGVWRDCRLIGRGQRPATVRLAIWCEGGEIGKEGRRPIKFTDCLLPLATQVRLETVARAQDPPPGAEKARAIEFICRVRRQRRRNGQFADGLHGAERKGRR